MFLDMMYHVNDYPPTAKEALQIIDFVQTLGFYNPNFPKGKVAYQCTDNMIDELCRYLQDKVSTLTTKDQVDLAIALQIIPLKPVLDVVTKCLTNVTLGKFKEIWFDLAFSTHDFFDLVDKHLHFIEDGNLSIGLLCRYFVGSKQEVTVKASVFKLIFEILSTWVHAFFDG